MRESSKFRYITVICLSTAFSLFSNILFANFLIEAKVSGLLDRLMERQVDMVFVEELLSEAKYNERVIRLISKPAEHLTWAKYRNIFLKKERVTAGVKFYGKHKKLLERVAKIYKIPVAVILAIVGVETYYGKIMGEFRVIDSLSTLAFKYPPRGKFFERQLEELFLLSNEEPVDINSLLGSYAGAVGYGQFIPSSYRVFSVDFNGDGVRDLVGSIDDAMGSVANYLSQHNWDHRLGLDLISEIKVRNSKSNVFNALKFRKKAQTLAADGVSGIPQAWIKKNYPVSLLKLEVEGGFEQWAVTSNFKVITRYNRSPLYAMAVCQLALEIEAELDS